MPFTGAISNQSSIRSGASFDRHVVIHTPDVVMQAQPSANASGRSNAVITVGTPSTGSVAAIQADYTVIVTPTADYANDLQRLDPTEYLLTYARLDGSGSSVFIGETTFNWTTGQYVTVLKDVRVHHRKLRYTETRTEYRDYGITYRTPKPRIYDLYSEALEIAPGDSTVTKSFTPSADAMNGGSISTWSWDVDGNTISTGTSSDQNISVDFAAGTHLVSLTVTDNAGVSNTLHVLIAAVPSGYNSVIHEGVTVNQLDHSEDGHVCTLTQYTDIEPILPGSMALVCTKVRYADGTDELHTDMVGWIGDITQEAVGDATYQRLESAGIGVLDVSYLMQNLSLQSLPFELKTSPAAWGELASCTPLDIAWHILSELSTVPNVAAVDYPSDYGNQTIKEYNSPNGTLLDICRSLAFSNYCSSLQFAPNGELVFEASLPYATTAVRNAATTIATLTIQDADIRLRRPPAGGIFAVRYTNVGAARYDTTTNKMRTFYGRAPAEVENGILEEVIRFMVLPEDTGAISGTAFTGGIAYDHWAASNDNLTATLTCLGGYLKLRQNQYTWLKLSVSAGDLINSDATFGSSDRFVVTSVSQQYDHQQGSLIVSVNMRYETGNTSNYSVISQELFAAIVQAQLGIVPPVPAYPELTESDPPDTYGEEYEDEVAGEVDPAEDPTVAVPNAGSPSAVYEQLTIPATGETVTTSNALTGGSNFLITISGTVITGNPDESIEVNFDEDAEDYGSYSAVTGAITDITAYGSNGAPFASGFSEDDALLTSTPGGGGDAVASVDITLTTATEVSSISFYAVALSGNATPANGQGDYRVQYYDADDNELGDTGWVTMGSFVVGSPTYSAPIYVAGTFTPTPITSNAVAKVRISARSVKVTANTTVAILDEIFIETVSDNVIRQDAHFKLTPDGGVTALAASGGVNFNGSNLNLSSCDPNGYSENNIYTFTQAGSGSAWTFAVVDIDGDYTDNSGVLYVRIESY